MKKLVFLFSFMTIGYIAETYPQLSEYTDTSYTGWPKMNQYSGTYNILKSSYPGSGGYLDNRMILDSTALYYSPGPAAEELKVASSVYAYDARLNKIEEINCTRDSTTGKMKKEHRYVYDYNADGNQTDWASYFWNSQTREWAGCWR